MSELSRRGFVQLLGAGALSACSSRPARDIRPYVREVPELTPGVPQYYATALVEDGFATGVVVEAHEGRPTKIEGNPDHPASLGATRAIEQAAIMALYDPARIAAITDRGMPAAWHTVAALLARGPLHVVMEPTTSPLAIARIERLKPRATFSFWSPFALRSSLAGNRLAFGRPLQTQLELGAADVVVALDFAEHPMQLAYMRQLADRRRVADAHTAMSRIYAIETSYTQIGVLADHRFRARPSEIEAIAAALLAGTGEPWVQAIGRDLRRAAGRAVVIAGEAQPPVVHALVAAINASLGSTAVHYTEPVAYEAGRASHALPAIDPDVTLLVLGGELPIAMPPSSIYVGLTANATSAACRFVVPALHDLERWGAARAFDGTLAPIQPLIEPLVPGHAIEDVLAAALGEPPRRPRDELALLVPALEPALARGVISGPAAPVEVALAWDARVPPRAAAPLELAIRPHPFLHDGRYATNPWLRELPEPITKLTWDAAVQLSPRTAARLGVSSGDVLALRDVALPAIVTPGHADEALTANVPWLAAGPVEVRATGERVELAITQEHWSLGDRPIALAADLATLDAAQFEEHRGPQPTLLADRTGAGPQWAMSIDLTTCTGCTACVMACASENNTPVVGKARVLERREMHWLRIDRYVDDGGEVAMQPMACQHCEKAPCEYVCPVEATTHSPDGLNEMAYNRCVGTRFCSNNCPYKVRRFNWFDFKERDGLRVLGKNPDVTIRDRGVMEKCTYCVQRIRRTEIDARIANRPIGEVRTACQQACPTQAIAFGSLADPAMVELRARPHSYAVLHDQGAVPRTHYLARIRNRNPEIP